jgi:SAM-dependent methyltransferase
MTGHAPFDRSLERDRRRRRPPALPDPIAGQFLADVKDRLSLINRPLQLMAVAGPFAPQVAASLAAEGRRMAIDGQDLAIDLESLPFGEATLDCFLSIFGLETVNDVPGALLQIRRALKPDGVFLACLFAGETLRELRQSWILAEQSVRGGASPRVAPMTDIRTLGSLLQRAGFALPVADLDRTVARYDHPLSLMREIRQLGFASPLHDRSRTLLTRRLLAEVMQVYSREFGDPDGRVHATFDVAWLTGWAPHESQQVPLRPGSARARLADALGTPESPLKRD